MLPHLYGRFRRPLPRSAIARLPSGASPAEIAASKMRCARLAAPFVTALCIFDTLRCGSAARRSYIMVSSRASSSPMPQPASRHSIKPFSIQPIIANIRHSAVSTSQYRFAIWGRRCGECPFAFSPQRISRSESGFIANVGYDDENNISDARVADRRDASPQQSDVARAGRLFAA